MPKDIVAVVEDLVDERDIQGLTPNVGWLTPDTVAPVTGMT